MSEAGKLVQLAGTAGNARRVHAVAAAVEVIAARASAGTPLDLGAEFANLSTYADQIQAAIEKK